MNPILDQVIAYADRGWRVVPLHDVASGACSCGREGCASGGKHPRPRAWQNEASSDPAVIRAWWKQWPRANVGIATGEGSGVWVLDIDGPAGEASLDELEFEHGELPATLTARTGSGGRHFFFKTPAGLTIPSNAKRLGPGLDLRGEGGQVVAAPSVSAKGAYAWTAYGAAPDAPQWLLAKIAALDAPPPEKAKPAPRMTPARKIEAGEVDLVAEIERAFPSAEAMAAHLGVTIEAERTGKNGERERHARGFAGLWVSVDSGAWHSHGNHEGGGSVIALANYIRNGANEIPKGKAFVDLARVLVPAACAQRDAAFEARQDSKAKRDAERAERDLRWAEIEAKRAADAGGWNEPVTPDGPHPPRVEAGASAEWPDVELDPAEPEPMAFPSDALPGRIQAWAESWAHAHQSPVDFFGLGALAAASVAVLQKVVVDGNPWKVGIHTEQPSLYILAAAPPGSMKSAAADVISKPLVDHEYEARREWEKEKDRLAPELSALAGEIQRLKKAVASGKATDLDTSRLREIGIELKLRTPQEPASLRLTDPTLEALSVKMGKQDERAGVFDAEGKLLSTITGHYSGKVELDLVKKAFNGETYHAIRITREELRLQSPLLTILSFTQNSVIEALGAKPQLKGEGFLGRCLISIPKTTVGERNVNPEYVAANAPADDVLADYDQAIRYLLNIPIMRDHLERVQPFRVEISKEASAVLTELRMELEPMIHPEHGSMVHIADFVAKLHGHALRLALMVHLLERAHGDCGDWRGYMRKPAMEAGVRLARYALDHHQIAFRSMTLGGGEDCPSNAGAPQGKLIRAILALDPDGDGARLAEVERRVKHDKVLGTRTGRDTAMAALVRGGFVRLETVKAAGKGRPMRRVHANPSLRKPSA